VDNLKSKEVNIVMEPGKEENWAVLMEVYNQEEAQLISGLLLMAGIPVRMDHEAIGEVLGLTVGPLAKIKITVPEDRVEDAYKVLSGEVDVSEEPGDDKIKS
jgi:CRP-like cAMP-binding protein